MNKLELAREFLGAIRPAAMTAIPVALLAVSAHASNIICTASAASGCGTSVQLDYNTQLTDMSMSVNESRPGH